MCHQHVPARRQPSALRKSRRSRNGSTRLNCSAPPTCAYLAAKCPQGASDEQGIQWVAETMKPACDYAAPRGITLGIESHGGITSKATNILEILRRVDSPYAGCNLDISNFPEDPYTQIEACIPYATHTHIRDFYGEAQKASRSRARVEIVRAGRIQGFYLRRIRGRGRPDDGRAQAPRHDQGA